MQRESIEAAIRQRFSDLVPVLKERERRLWAAVEAKALGYGGISMVARATGISRRALRVALEALVEPTARGEPESALRWTGKGVRRLASELQAQGFQLERQKVADLRHE